MSNFLELTKSRRSVRTFDGKMIDSSLLEELKTYSENIKNPYDVPVRFVFLDADKNKLSSPVLSGEKLYVAAVVGKVRHAAEAYGYAFEDLLMKAHELGLGTVWIGGTMPRDKFEAAAEVGENEIMPCISPLGKVSDKMSVKETLMRRGVKADKRLDFEEIFFDGSFNDKLSKGSAMGLGLNDALECVRLAPSAVNKQPWRVVIGNRTAHFYVKHDKGYITPDYDLQRIDVGIGLYHFERKLIEDGKTPVLEVNDPGFNNPDQVDYVASYRW